MTKGHVYLNGYWNCIKTIIFDTFKDRKILIIFCGSFILLGIEVIANIGLPLVLKETIDQLSDSKHLQKQISFILISYGVLWLLSQIALHFRYLLTYHMEQRLIFALGIKIVSHIYTLSHDYFLNQKTGKLTNIIRRAQRDVPAILIGIFLHVIPTFIEFTCVICIVFLYYPMTYGILMGVTLIAFFVYASFSMKTALEKREKANEIDQNADGIITDWLLNYEAVKIFGRYNLAIQVCKEQLKKRETSEIRFMTHFSLSRLGQSMVLGLGLIILTCFSGKGVEKGELTVGDFILFNGYILRFITPISILGQVTQDIKKAIVDMKDVIRILLAQSEIQEVSSPVSLRGDQFSIEFKNVNFQYSDREIIKDLSFVLLPGETVLFIGPTGIGKSTVAKLLLRLYEPTSGNVFINHVDIRHLSFDSLYANIGWVPQESFFLNDTIERNLLFASPQATPQDVENALDSACLLDFIKKLPNGLKTLVGDRGVKLSGGEKQRLALARLFLKKPKICIFDEATSFLDRKTELAIQKNIKSAFPCMTKIIITHRPFMEEDGNQIINLQKPELKKVGHFELKAAFKVSSKQQKCLWS